MSEEQAFVQAMLESPNDLTLRMVFADWLEERGDPRGELLRLTHTLTQAIDVPGRSELETRMQKLVEEGVSAVGPFWTNSIGMRFAWIPPGRFLMGSQRNEKDRNKDEIQHRVTLTQGFFLGIYPVTNAQWQTVIGDNFGPGSEQLPVVVAWEDATAFCQKLTERDGKRYCLPTEAEWEYACRAGSTSAYCFGNHPDKLGDFAWYWDNASQKTPSVGQKKPNSFGLYDMHGNVNEWCNDRYGKYPDYDTPVLFDSDGNVWEWCDNGHARYPVNEAVDPGGSLTGKYRVLRGGSRTSAARNARCASRVAGRSEVGVEEEDDEGEDLIGGGLRICCCLD